MLPKDFLKGVNKTTKYYKFYKGTKNQKRRMSPLTNTYQHL